MLSIEEVKNVSFRRANLGGYRAEDVDAFIEDVVATLEQNRRDKVELVKKLDILAKRIEQYRKDEESVRGALINAEKVKESAAKESQEKADSIIKEAQAQAKQIIYNANASVVNQKNNYLKLQADAVVLREQLLETYNNHIRMLEDLPTSADIGKKKVELDATYPTDDSNLKVEPQEIKAELPKEKSEPLVDISTETIEMPNVTDEAVNANAEEAVQADDETTKQ